MLTHNDVVDILTAITAGDRRTIGETDISFWKAVLAEAGMTSRRDCLAAVARHFATSDEYLKPIHVIRGVRAIRGARLDHAPTMTQLMDDVDPEDPNWTRIYRDRRSAIADGQPGLKAVGS